MNHTNLWAPWRMAYLNDLMRKQAALDGDATGRRGGGSAAAGTPQRSFLEEYWLHPESDAANLVIYRNGNGFLVLNRYPYANGHLLVALGEPRPRLLDYPAGQRAGFWRLVDLATDLMEQALHPQGINMGINQGEAAGAGLPGHFHAHLVPRWHGDTNFMEVVGAIRVIPDSLTQMADMYRRTVSAGQLSTD